MTARKSLSVAARLIPTSQSAHWHNDLSRGEGKSIPKSNRTGSTHWAKGMPGFQVKPASLWREFLPPSKKSEPFHRFSFATCQLIDAMEDHLASRVRHHRHLPPFNKTSIRGITAFSFWRISNCFLHLFHHHLPSCSGRIGRDHHIATWHILIWGS